MPPRKRTDTHSEAPADHSAEPLIDAPDPQPEAGEQPAATRKPRKPAVEPPCPTCFPDGWPAEATSAGCSHGTWNRTL